MPPQSGATFGSAQYSHCCLFVLPQISWKNLTVDLEPQGIAAEDLRFPLAYTHDEDHNPINHRAILLGEPQSFEFGEEVLIPFGSLPENRHRLDLEFGPGQALNASIS